MRASPELKRFPLVLSLAVFTLLFVVVSYFFLDKPISGFFYGLKLHETQAWLYAVTFLGQNTLVIPLLFLVLLYLSVFHAKTQAFWKGAYIFSTVFLCNLIGVGLKICLGRARPLRWFAHDQYGFFGPIVKHDYWSMPSGHAITVMAVAFSCAILWPKHRYWIYLLAFILLLTRIILMKHYLSDLLLATVIAGLVAQFLYVFGFARMLNKKQANPN